jgi:2,4-dienoyl-CoA reductase-like NADH-dependent reductase (Old Yellow Enzyme family)
MPFPHVFEPLTIRHRTLKSRINFGAHTANMAEAGCPASAMSAITASGRSVARG